MKPYRDVQRGGKRVSRLISEAGADFGRLVLKFTIFSVGVRLLRDVIGCRSLMPAQVTTNWSQLMRV